MNEEIANVNIIKPSQAKKKPAILKKVVISASSSRNQGVPSTTTQIGHDFDPEKQKSPSKRRKIVRPKRKPQSQNYYRRRLEYFDQKQTNTKADVTAFHELAQEGLSLIPAIMDGKSHVQCIFPLYIKAVKCYNEAMLKLRQTVLTERKLAAEVWGDNSIASFNVITGIYTVNKEMIQQNLLPRVDEVKPPNETTKKQSTAAAKRKKPTEVETLESVCDISDFIDCDYMAVTRSQTRRSTGNGVKAVVVKEETQELPASKKKTVNAKRKSPSETPEPPPKKTRGASPKETISKAPPPPPPPSVKEHPMPQFIMITESEVARSAEHIIKEPPCINCYCKPDKNGNGCFEDCQNRSMLMECGSRCPVGPKCQNKRFQKRDYAGFEPFFAGAKGWGIRATKPIKRGDFIVEYVGEVVDTDEMKKRQIKYTKKNFKHHYMMCLKNKAVIDATIYGNYSRFVNHSCDPNAETQKWSVSKDLRVGFFAKKDIAPGEEIVFDYAFERFGKEAQKCYCGAENCTGFIGSKPQDDDEEIDNDNDDSSDSTDESESEASKNLAAKKPLKPKLTQEEKDFRKRLAKSRKKLIKHRREVRAIIGRKKNFSTEDVLEFTRKIYRIDAFTERLLILDYLLSVPDEQWLTFFVENNGLMVIFWWLLDCNNYEIKTLFRLQIAVVNFLHKLPIKYIDDVKEKILPILKERMDVHLPDSYIIQNLLNEVIDSVCDDQVQIADKDLARMLNMDGVLVSELITELTQSAQQLCEKLSKLPSRPPVASLHEDTKLVDISDEDECEGNNEKSDEQNNRGFDFNEPSPMEFENSPMLRLGRILNCGNDDVFSSKPSQPVPHSSPTKTRDSCQPSRSKSRSRSPLRKRRRSPSRSRSPVSFDTIVQRTARRACRIFTRRSESDRSSTRSFNSHRERYSDDRYRDHYYNDRRRDRYYDDRPRRGRDDKYHHERRFNRHHENRDYENSYRGRRFSRQHHNGRWSDRDHKRNYSISNERSVYNSHTRNHSSENGRNHGGVTIKTERPDTPPVVNEPLPKSPVAQSSFSAIQNELDSYAERYKDIFPDAVHVPLPVPPPEALSSTELPSTSFTGMGPKFRPTLQCVGYANVLPTRPQIRFDINKFSNQFQPTLSNASSMSSTMPLPPRDPFANVYYQPPPPPEISNASTSVNLLENKPYIDVSIPPPAIDFSQAQSLSSGFENVMAENGVTQRNAGSSTNIESSNNVPVNHHESSILNSTTKLITEIKVEDISPTDTYSQQSQPSSDKNEEDETEVIEKVRPFSKNPDWIETFTDEGIIYYYHKQTRETRWDEPPPKEVKISQSKSSLTPNPTKPVDPSHSEKKSAQIECTEELKKSFKLLVWRHIHNYLVKSKKEAVQNMEESVLTQFARKMTHFTLNFEFTKNRNTKYCVTDAVYAKARSFADQHFPALIEHSIKQEPLNA